jgi:hypothetical protein
MTRPLAALALAALLGGPAAAQGPLPPSLGGGVAPAPLAPGAAIGAQPLQSLRGQVSVALSAAFAGDNQPIRSGLVWRIYEDRGDAVPPTVAARSTEAAPTLTLAPGSYIVHAAYGFAGASRRITIGGNPVAERVTIGAGALRLGGAINETPIPPNRLSFSVYVPLGSNSEGRLVLANAKAGDIIRLPEGTYHVVSTYGDSNAIMRADLKVDSGKVTEATLNHRAATVTLKLVANLGGEAFAGTAFSVLTPGGDVIREAIGAFPSVTLAEGDYVLIARHEGDLFTREFKVESGVNRDIEIQAVK